jgi:TPP-dependent indolepyruvate ferredoxin oxidoreductase alpha subunit
MKSQMWLLDPRPNLPSIVHAVKMGFELSEASHTPVMLQLRIRACHVHGRFIAADNQRPTFTLEEAMENPQRDVSRIVLPPASFLHEQEKIHDRWPAAVRFIETQKLNEFFSEDADDIGIIVQCRHRVDERGDLRNAQAVQPSRIVDRDGDGAAVAGNLNAHARSSDSSPSGRGRVAYPGNR